MANIKSSKLLELLIHKATKKAYINAYDWMSSDSSIASQLRDGIRTTTSSFSEINSETEDVETLLALMQEKLEKNLKYYRQLPGDYGQWECSALNIITRSIANMRENKYAPSPEEITGFEIDEFLTSGFNYYIEQDYAKALDQYLEAVEYQISKFGVNHEDVATSYSQIGLCNYMLKQYEKAIENHKTSLDIRNSFDSLHEGVANSYWIIAHCFYMLKQYSQAITNYKEQLDYLRKIFGEKHLKVADSLLNIAECYNFDSKYEIATPFYQDAFTIKFELLGSKHEDVATCYYELGVNLYWDSEYEQAAENLRLAYELRKELLGEEDHDTKSTYEYLEKARFEVQFAISTQEGY